MALITSIAEFQTYLLEQMGSPVITVEISQNQLISCINDSIDIFNRYNYVEGNSKSFVSYNLSAGVSSYDLSGTGINDIADIVLGTGGNGSINQLFTPANMILSPVDFARLTNFQIVDYHMAMMKLSEINDYFSIRYRAEYNPSSQQMLVIPTPQEANTVLIECYKKETAINLYNNVLVKKLALARALIIWGRILKKYNVTLPGGGTINGDAVFAEGKEMETQVMIDIKGESPSSIFFVA